MDAECEFSQDCQNVDFCRNIAVSWCCSKSPKSTHFYHLNEYVPYSSLSKTLPEFRNSGCVVCSIWVWVASQKLCPNFEIQDAWCVCRFGSCVVDGICWAGELCGDPECSNYTDCDCRWGLDHGHCLRKILSSIWFFDGIIHPTSMIMKNKKWPTTFFQRLSFHLFLPRVASEVNFLWNQCKM